jgi:hypothetical protein
MIFHATDAPLGAKPVATEGPNHDAYLLATNACDGWADEDASIAADPDLKDPGKAKAKGKALGTRFARLTDADGRLVGEGFELKALLGGQRAAAGLVAPDPTAELRAQSIRATYASLSPSDRLAAVRNGSPEVLKALYHAPDMGGAPLVDPKLRVTIEERLVGGLDKDRAEALAVRVEDNRRARHAVDRAKRYLGKAQSLRERLITNKGK